MHNIVFVKTDTMHLPSLEMATTRTVLITLVLVLFTTGAAYPNAVEKRESAENEAVEARDQVCKFYELLYFLSCFRIFHNQR